MLDYTKVTPPLSVDCHCLTKRMLSLVLDDGEGQSCCEIDREASTVEDICPDARMKVLRTADESRNRKRETGRSHLLPSSALTQLTVNESLPGQGIAQHVGRYDKHLTTQMVVWKDDMRTEQCDAVVALSK